MAGWPTSARYRLVLAGSRLPLASSVIGLFSGTSAGTLGMFLAASSSSSAWEVAGVLLLARSGAVNGVQPSAGSRKLSTRALSLPLPSFWAPAMLAALAAVFWAVWPVFGSTRYVLVTLSLWSWSTMSKLRTVGHCLPVPSRPPVGTSVAEVPALGTCSRPMAISANAARKKLVPLQNDTWPKGEPRPLTQLPCASALAVAPTWIRLSAWNPKSMVTIAFLGSFGTTGATAGVVPCVMTRGL